MKIEVIKSITGHKKGDKIEVSDRKAKRLIQSKRAVEYTPPKKKAEKSKKKDKEDKKEIKNKSKK